MVSQPAFGSRVTARRRICLQAPAAFFAVVWTFAPYGCLGADTERRITSRRSDLLSVASSRNIHRHEAEIAQERQDDLDRGRGDTLRRISEQQMAPRKHVPLMDASSRSSHRREADLAQERQEDLGHVRDYTSNRINAGKKHHRTGQVDRGVRVLGTARRRRRAHQDPLTHSLQTKPFAQVPQRHMEATPLLQIIEKAEATPGVELVAGVLVGLLCAALALSMGYCPQKLTSGRKTELNMDRRELSATMQEESPNILSEGKLVLPPVQYNGAFFQQFSWVVDRGQVSDPGGDNRSRPSGARRDQDSIVIRDSRFREVARAYGRLMAVPNGEMRIESNGVTWAILRRPVPSRRTGHLGQLWDFKIFRPDGQPFAEVRQRSDTKCIAVEPQPSQRRIMAAIGNFTYPVFLTGERNIHVWTVQGGDDGRPGLVAQCESTVSEPGVDAAEVGFGSVEGAASGRDHAQPANGINNPQQADSETSAMPMSTTPRRLHVSTTAGADASLVLAMLLGLQDVHRTSRRIDSAASTASAATAPAAPHTGDETSQALENPPADGQSEQEKAPTPREPQPASAA